MDEQNHLVPEELKGLDNFSKLLDTRFRIPFTNLHFGLDFLIGLIPYGGDLFSFLFSGGLVITMAKHGVSGQVIAKMIWNIVLDTVVGTIPIFGDIFDLYFRSNRRNYYLLEQHYGEHKYQGSIWRVVIPVLLVLLLLLVLMIWLMIKVMAFGWDALFS